MKIPSKIKVSGVWYKIEIAKDTSDDMNEAQNRGRVLFGKGIIKILDSYFPESKNRTLLHEIIHILDDDLGLDLEEKTIRRLASGLYQVLKDNNLLKEGD